MSMDEFLNYLLIAFLILLLITKLLSVILKYSRFLLYKELFDNSLTVMGKIAEDRWSILNQLLVLDGATDSNVQELYDNIMEERISLAEDVTVEALLADNVLFEQTHKEVLQRLSKNSDYNKVIENTAIELEALDELYDYIKEMYNVNVKPYNESIKETFLFKKVFDATEKEIIL